MSLKQLAFNATTMTVTAQAKGDALPVGSIKLPDYHHSDSSDEYGPNVSHALYHHVRDALYKLDPLNYKLQNMQLVTILNDIDYIAVVSFTVVPESNGLTVGQTQQITHVWTPTNASNKKVTYASSHPLYATVSNTGLVTAVSAGVATITCTAEDGSTTGTYVVTVT